jgi:hypothetical protein
MAPGEWGAAVIELDATSGALRLDDDELAALLAAADGSSPDAELVAALDGSGSAAALGAVRASEVTLDLVVAGASSVLVHRAWVDPERAVVALGVRAGLHQVMVLPPAHVAAALVRMTRLRPRRTGVRAPRPHPAGGLDALVSTDDKVRSAAFAEAEAGFAWRLGVSWAGSPSSVVTAIDGRNGLFLADEVALHPVSNTMVYRAFTTVLVAGDPPPAQ